MSTFQTPLPPGAALARITPSAKVPELRYTGDPLLWIGVPALTQISAFASGSVRIANGEANGLPGDLASEWTLFELSPFPQMDPPAFKRIAGGLPVQLVLVRGSVAGPPDSNDFFAAGAPLIMAPAGAGSTAFLSFAFQDRLCRDPLTWAEAIAASGACDAVWPQFVTELAALPGSRNLRVLDACGFPLKTGTVDVAIDGQPPTSSVLTESGDGDTGINVPAGSQATITMSSAAHPILAPGDVDAGAFESGLRLAPGARLAQAVDAHLWLAEPDPGVNVKRWSPDSNVEPIVDGTPYFKRLVTDLRSTKPGGAVGFAGWAFVKDSLTNPGVDWPLVPGDGTTTFLNLVRELRDAGTDVRVLAPEFLRFDSDSLDDAPELPLIVLAFYISLSPLQAIFKLQTDPAGYLVAALAIPAVVAALTTGITLELIKNYADLSKDMMAALRAIDPSLATYTFYPAAFADNPLVTTLPPSVLGHDLDDISHSGCYHQKFVIIKSPGGNLVGYLGGIDINSNRPDTPLHRARFPYHDIQARITGPAVVDMIRTYEERAVFHSAAVPIRTPAEGSVQPSGSHLMQVSRTYFKPRSASPTPALSFAPSGESTSARTMLGAIRQAQDYIYIEDQYFVPPDEYVQALMEAADRGVRALFITMPYQIDLLYGARRRSDVLGARLVTRWGSRLHAGAPLRRFAHETPALTTNLGRMRLAAKLDRAALQCDLGPLAHIPPPPFWAFVDSELVFVYAPVGPPSGSGSDAFQTMHIERAQSKPSWGAQPVEHTAGAPVLAVQIPQIYVHAKVLIVDDVFLFIGSSNVNRRSLYHDGELNAFVVPQHLKGDPNNPARVLRSRLMAEHMGLSPELGRALFADPISAFDYLTQRSWYTGALRQPLDFFGSLASDIPLGTADSVIGFLLEQAKGIAQKQAAPDVWPLMVDPTTDLQPPPLRRGPEYP